MPIASTVTIISAISDTVISIVTSVISGCTFVPTSPAVIIGISVITVATPSSSQSNIVTCINTVIAIINPTVTTPYLTPAIATTSPTIPETK